MMIKQIRQSLANKIVLSALVGILLIFGIIFTVFTSVATDALKKSEFEKASLIAKTYAPLFAINIFLDRQDSINTLAKQLIENNNILSVNIYSDDTLIKSLSLDNHKKSIFFVSEDIMHPSSNTKLGKLEILYSNHYYEKTFHTYFIFMLQITSILLILTLIYSLYIKRLLSPLKKIRKVLTNYRPENKSLFPNTTRDDEIGLISSSFNLMQVKILNYAQKQKNINKKLEKKVSEKTEELRHQLYYDELTNLPNRTSLIHHIINLEHAVLLIINIDDFKEINDFYGHHIGDRLLKKFADRVHVYLSTYSYLRLYHLKGDEFSIVYDNKINEKLLQKHALMLIDAIEQMQFILQEHSIRIRVSIGATQDMTDAIEKADMALKKARKNKQSYLLYSEEHSIKIEYKENLEWASKIKDAIADDRIIPFYQPIFDAQTDKILSYESLIRLREVDGSIVAPYKFLDIAKKARLYPELTKIMIEKSCQYFADKSTTFSVNLSFQDMVNSDITNFIEEKIEHYGVSKRIIFEILESEEIHNYEEIALFIQKMHSLGCKISIDDFGSGYSNYEHLLNLHIDYIKIDGSLIKNIDTDLNAQILVETILDFAKKLNIKTIAEYVHKRSVLSYVKKIGIDRTQGFLLGEPQEEISSQSFT